MKERSTMHIPPELSSYVRDALQSGRSKDDVHSSLKSANWTETEIVTALSGWMICDGAGAVPRPVRSSAARDALFYALLFVVFGMVAGNTLALLFAQIKVWLPEPDELHSYSGLATLRWSMAALIVFVPVFWAMDRKDRRAAASDSSRKHGTMRRWLSAIAMLVAVITLLGDALYLIYSWLDGQITLRFLVKSVTVALMSLIVLAYFRENRDLPFRFAHLPAAWVLTGLAMIALGLTLWIVGGPAQGQMEQRDRWRISDLRSLTADVAACSQIDRANLPGMLDPLICARNPVQLTGYATAITYQRIAPTDFELCTEVEFPSAIQAYDLRVDANRVCLQRSME
ncbi:DUF5671 domain-containing protein [Aliiruegeria sabulilitoris]|uniref:DUF5671 domain-containing protein n=1 Tax=Aliiruegeria sabulilitoris TaxID=1510458 RepID=UPI000ACFF37E|nr:DUF5671 domain-containing protein [Aliiruegeria sabulilitoris]